jgi:uncharacterized protein YjbJ (UPF0337 family)
MNWNIIEGKWKEVSGSLREKWGDLTDDEIQSLSGKRDQLEGVIQTKYGITQEQAKQQIDEWANWLKERI